MKYDGLLFGNGLSLNLIKQITPHIKVDKRYLLNVDSFINAFIHAELSFKEEQRIFKLFYRKKDIQSLKHFEQIRQEFGQYFCTHNGNIEYCMGQDLFKENICNYDYSRIKSLFPAMYNIWHEILIEYLTSAGSVAAIQNYQNSIKSVLTDNPFIFTTNFDRLFERLNPKHLHGIFIKDYCKYDQLILNNIDEHQHNFKCIWGWNGYGKLKFIKYCKSHPEYEKYFDFDFFFDNSFHIKDLLIYGMGFQPSGYVDEMSENISIYEKPNFGGIIDEHILWRLQSLQSMGQLENIVFSYYSEADLTRYKQLVEYFNLSKVEYIHTNKLPFSI